MHADGSRGRAELVSLLESSSPPLREAFRARLVLAALEGASNAEVAEAHGVSVPTVALWRGRYEREGVAGLRDRPRSGRPRLGTATPPPSGESGDTPADRSAAIGPPNDATLEMLLETATGTIARRGFGATRVADIAADAGVSPATIHYYFQTKDDILLRALLWANARLTSHLEQISSGAEDPLVRLSRFIERTIPYPGVQRDEYMVEIDLWSRIRSQPELLPAWEAYAVRWNTYVGDLVRDGIDKGLFRPVVEPEEFVQRLSAMTDGLAAKSAIGSRRMPPKRVREIVLRFAAEQLGVELALLEESARLPRMARKPTAP